eukprot:sb/3469330/
MWLKDLNESLRSSYDEKRNELAEIQDLYNDTSAKLLKVETELESERETRELYQMKFEESIRSDSVTDEDSSLHDIPSKILGSPQRLGSPPMSSVAHELAAELEQSIHLSVIDLEEQLDAVNDEKSRLSDIVAQHKQVSDIVAQHKQVRDIVAQHKQEIETRFYKIQEGHQNMINDLSKEIIKLKHSNNELKTADFLSHETIIQLVSTFFQHYRDYLYHVSLMYDTVYFLEFIL